METELQRLTQASHNVGALEEIKLLLQFIRKSMNDLEERERLLDYVESRVKLLTAP